MGTKYPHMLKREERIWDAYLAEYGMPAGRIDYDVHLGEGAPISPEWPEWMAVMVKALSTKRADVVAETRFSITIFEIKRRAGLSCLGQLLGYEALMTKERGGWKPINLVAVCAEIEPDMAETFSYYKVEVIQISL
jgi:hypothetical protein